MGDINIGGFITNSLAAGCNFAAAPLVASEAIAYAVNLVNKDPHLLPNISLGFVLVNDGYNTSATTAKAFRFLPRKTCKYHSDDTCFCTSMPPVGNITSWRTDHHFCHYDVIGVISPTHTHMAVPVSYAMSAAQIPVVGCYATGDELSDKSLHPYFLRVISPTNVRLEALLAFIHSNGWSYIAVFYTNKLQGESKFQALANLAPRYNICVGFSKTIAYKPEYDTAVKALLKSFKGRVVVLFITDNTIVPLFQAIDINNANGTFIWIFANSIMSTFKSGFGGFKHEISGAFILSNYASVALELRNHLEAISINCTRNAWFNPWLDKSTGCFFTTRSSANDFIDLEASDFIFGSYASLHVDAVMVFAHAVTKLLADLCPGLTGAAARACIKGEDLLYYMKFVSFDGSNGRIEFDNSGDGRNHFTFWQTKSKYGKQQGGNSSSEIGLVLAPVAVYNTSTKQINYTGDAMSWDHLTTFQRDRSYLIKSQTQTDVPESVCSKPCLPGEYIIYTEVECCWECRTCRENEIIVNHGTKCQECVSHTWPDQETNYSTCKGITATFPWLSDPITVILLSLGSLITTCTIIVVAVFIFCRSSPVIKASSRELSFLQLAAIALGCLTVVLLQLPPTDTICGTVYFTLSLSFTWLYAPLLVKSLRLYRIFLGSMYNRKPRLISSCSQIVLSMLLISLQVFVCLVIYIIYKPAAEKTQPVATKKYVELACDITHPGLLSILAYNTFLVFICSVLAFKTRKLPDNFNEALHIFMCVATTLIVWMAFVPAYLTASHASVKTIMISVCMVLNHTVALVFLFIPRIYAVVHTSVEAQPTTTFQFATVQKSDLCTSVAPIRNELPCNEVQMEIKE
ncbi:hypothetical protein BsWGS_03706 [Bradybaena similaris]